MKHLILGTAGHIDHGKTALVRALTGVDTDRLPEEKQRGITIDLGFANLRIGDLSFGVVDVPGHEDFIRNMLAGASGMDVVLLVVAADEGVMPQTREHLAILDLLGLRCGVVAITKSDLATDEWTELVIDDVRAVLNGTSLAEAPIVPISATTGAGLDDLRSAIAQQAARPDRRAATDAFRMPIDRTFTVHGTGTVITGTVWSGGIRMDEVVRILPCDVRARIRGIQVHGKASTGAQAGERAAIALSGVEKTAIQRGDVAVGDAPWTAARMLMVRARMIAGTDWLLKTRQRIRVHVGTAEVLARAVVMGEELAAGQEGWVQLRLESSVVARAGDRVVFRSYSPVTTIGGGIVAEISTRKRSRLAEADAGSLSQIISGNVEDAVRAAVSRSSYAGITSRELVLDTPHALPGIERALEGLRDDVVRIGDRWFSAGVLRKATTEIIIASENLHRENPLKPYVDRAEVCGKLKWAVPELIGAALQRAISAGDLVANGSTLCRAGFRPELTPKQLAQRAQTLVILRESGLAPPTVEELGKAVGAERDIELIVRLLAHEGCIEAITREFYMDVNALGMARDRTRAELGGSSGLTAAQFRATLPVSRKHLIPILEYFDRIGITIREGDLRSVPRSSEPA